MMKLTKRSQIQLGESITIIIIVIILLVVGIAFWSKFNQADIKQSIAESQDRYVIQLAKTASELPELRCYSAQDVPKVNCFDWYKLLALNQTMHDPLTKKEAFDYYNGYFENSRITFEQLYPEDINITVYDNNISAQRSQMIVIPVVFEKSLGRRGFMTFGWIMVEGYTR